MRTQFFLSISLGLLSLVLSQSIQAQPKVTFFCGEKDGTPATIAKTAKKEIVLIFWKRVVANYSPQARCEEVSSRFQTHFNQGTLRYLTTGKINNESVICVANKARKACLKNGLLFTINPERNPNQTLKELFNASKFVAGGPVGFESSAPPQLFFDIGNFLDEPSDLIDETPANP